MIGAVISALAGVADTIGGVVLEANADKRRKEIESKKQIVGTTHEVKTHGNVLGRGIYKLGKMMSFEK